MLVLSRQRDGQIIIGPFTLTIVDIRGDKVRIGIDAGPKDGFDVNRQEVEDAITAERAQKQQPPLTAKPLPVPNVLFEGGLVVFSRKKNESFIINHNITVVVVEIRGDKVRLGVEAPKEVPVHRREVYDAIHRQPPPADDPPQTS